MQSHFVKLEPPYQIIHYGGVVGIQIGTLIVVGQEFANGIDIYTHSHPVVSYVDKFQLQKKLGKEHGNRAMAAYYGGGEGNVWSKVEVSDVDVIGLWDTNRNQDSCPFDWDDFVYLVSEGFSLADALKGTYRKNGILELNNYLRKVGLEPQPPVPFKHLKMCLSLQYKKVRNEVVRGYISCDEYLDIDSKKSNELRVSFCIPYNEKKLDQAIEIICHNMNQYLALIHSINASIEFVANVAYGVDNAPTDNPKDEENIAIIVKKLNGIYKNQNR